MVGRPREFDIEDALIKACHAFWENGYTGVSISDLVTILGIASARIYSAFGSKEALFKKSIEYYLEHEGGFVKRALLQTNSTPEFIHKLLLDAVDVYTNASHPKGCMVVLSTINCPEENKSIQLWLRSLRIEQTKLITQRIEEGINKNELPANSNSQLLGEYVATVLHGLSIQARDGVSREHLLATVNLCVATLPLT